jgi:hypothetical protein
MEREQGEREGERRKGIRGSGSRGWEKLERLDLKKGSQRQSKTS